MHPIDPPTKQRTNAATIFKLFVPSALGILIFFVPIELGGRSTILLDHMVTGLRSLMGEYSGIYALVMIVAGAAWFSRSCGPFGGRLGARQSMPLLLL
mgnify:CR=1 FL=1